ncbi:bromo and FHA domain-containing protein DDB_G0267958 [Drosophila innubila]|uniref:bromo and FHA domain-containing protein DDB_G0267958 n=1 Tax=Drosophila innubila TaxID=198719 RepID=UPI00148C2691|nr:bromo and FHA domain-containing protein DDB_G0267958 [Drosophila innubila]
MLRRELQTIKLKLSDLEEYEVIRRRKKTNEAIEAGRASSVTVTATETAPSTASSSSSSETEATQRRLERERANMPGWTQATIADSNTNSGSTEDSTSVQAVVDESDTIAELSDDGWVDIDEEDEDEQEQEQEQEEEEGAVGGEL